MEKERSDQRPVVKGVGCLTLQSSSWSSLSSSNVGDLVPKFQPPLSRYETVSITTSPKAKLGLENILEVPAVGTRLLSVAPEPKPLALK